ncbi:adenylate cyclase type 9 isoform X1 [Diorhabda carinulata]|uniref:adenylate cyclase type 9 isoform X1 n=1 Tax=Diorhabda carinulata TaxID=1163345 RepID=UPI0025A17E01|nr:adenylate cyclase type 9 isoform X1 [Diorhabda carinulata]
MNQFANIMKERERADSSSYVKSDIQEDNPSELVEDENTQLSLDPNVQMYLAQMSQESGCWGKYFPIPFERADQKSWWDPTFDSEILEEQFKKSFNKSNKIKFRYALIYLIVISSAWLTYYFVVGFLGDERHWHLVSGLIVLVIICLITSLIFTYTKFFDKNMTFLTFIVALLFIILSLIFLIVVKFSPVGNLALCIQISFLLYTLVPLKLYVSLLLGIFYSTAYELLNHFINPEMNSDLSLLGAKTLTHFAIHLIGFHICLMNNVRRRNTFMKVGQSLLVRRQLELEKRLKENMIHSLMPKSVADWLKKEDENFTRRQSSDSTHDIRSLFRPFNMDNMENVSILFADIVGFTKMSSNKNAEELVDILNNLFQRFDSLCKVHNCEKISTLGDCYYCVSGCPEARPDHAKCCVEMGLSMIQAIKQFDLEKNEGVNMRVGIHTGKVLCGIVGTKRFKFDVWSNDVTLANKMESTGKPGMVHVSEKTVGFLNDGYLLEDGDDVMGLRTYFILGRKSDRTPSYSGSFRAEGRQKYANSLQLFISPPSNSSSSPPSRPRVLSCDTSSNYIKPQQQSQHLLSPDVCKIKASSLPSILDLESDDTICTTPNNNDSSFTDDIKTPTSTASSGKYAGKLKSWKIPKFMRKLSDQKQDLEVDVFTVSPLPSTEDGYQQVPTIIEATVNGNKIDSSQKTDIEDLLKDNIDVKSYISQSRSDIGPYDYTSNTEFIRSGSYRSQYSRSPLSDLQYLHRTGSNRSRRGRSPLFDSLEPHERARSATVSTINIQRPKRSFELPSRLSSITGLEENLNQSRKDSGIRSNSRKSSMQQIDGALANSEMLHRVSGYYTASQFSINHTPQVPRKFGTFFDKNGATIQILRKQSDRQLIKCVQDNSKSKCSYFIKPPLSRLTLFFKDKEMEKQYRQNVHRISKKDEQDIMTLANSKFNTYLDVVVSLLVFLIISLGSALLYKVTTVWLITFFTCLLLQTLGIAFCFKSVVRWFDRVLWCFIRFYRWNFFGAILISLPLISAIANFINNQTFSPASLNVFSYLLFVGLVHFCNFTQLNCWMKNLLATVTSLALASTLIFTDNNTSCSYQTIQPNITNINDSSLILDNFNTTNPKQQISCSLYKAEIVLNLFILVILIWLLTREFEIGYRLSFHTNFVAIRDKNKVQSLKNQADYLIYNIVPEHVAEQLKKDAKYSENFKDVAIIFASIVNFNEMYDESYEGGREYLRVLNELIGDFDELLNRSEFHCVEKIKTIGSTFMAASGLNSRKRQQQKDPNEHLYALMDFAIELQHVVNDFNRDLLGFDLELRIGYNFGDVTAAVIGNTKLFYDIWGDAVNIASRMDSTGMKGKIQVGEHCLPAMQEKYEFELRGSVYVKGKDNMNVYFLKKKKTSPFLSVPDTSL